MTDKEVTLERLKKEAEQYSDKIDRRLTSYWQGLNTGHIDGAISERNKIIDDAKQKVTDYFANIRMIDLEEEDILEALETLKL